MCENVGIDEVKLYFINSKIPNVGVYGNGFAESPPVGGCGNEAVLEALEIDGFKSYTLRVRTKLIDRLCDG